LKVCTNARFNPVREFVFICEEVRVLVSEKVIRAPATLVSMKLLLSGELNAVLQRAGVNGLECLVQAVPSPLPAEAYLTVPLLKLSVPALTGPGVITIDDDPVRAIFPPKHIAEAEGAIVTSADTGTAVTARVCEGPLPHVEGVTTIFPEAAPTRTVTEDELPKFGTQSDGKVQE
jgi:hypothetical protein